MQSSLFDAVWGKSKDDPTTLNAFQVSRDIMQQQTSFAQAAGGNALMLRKILAGSRYFLVLAVISAFLASLAIIIYDFATTISFIFELLTHSLTAFSPRQISIEAVELIDLLLLGAVLYLVALGLYSLYIDDRLSLPRWLEIHDLDTLKDMLLRVIAVLLAVSFLGVVVEVAADWNSNTATIGLGVTIAGLGVAIALIMFAIGYLLTKAFGTHNVLRPTSAEEENEVKELHHE